MTALVLEVERFEGGVDGPALVIAHGLFGSKRNWAGLARRFAARGPAITVDLRNHGDSPWTASMRYEDMGADLLGVIAREAGGRAVLLGHSMGGKAAMAAALTRPEAVAALVVVDIAPIAYAHAEHGAIVEAMAAVDLAGVTRRSEVEPALADAAPDPALRAFLLQNLAIEPVDGGKRARWKPNLAAIRTSLPDLVGWPTTLDGRVYSGPTRMVSGARSDYVTDEGRARAGRFFPAATERRIEAGHWPHAEAPEAFFAAVDEFLAGPIRG